MFKDINLQLFAEEAGAGAEDKGAADKGSAAAEDKGAANAEDKAAATEEEKVYTKSHFEKAISDRLKREQKAWEAKIEDEKKKAAMTETEKLKAEKEEAEKKAKEINANAERRLIKAEVIAQAAKLNIVDADAAYLLLDKKDITVGEDDTISGIKEALTELIKVKPYLVDKTGMTSKTGDDQNDNKATKGGYSMDALIRRAAGR